MNSKEIFNGFSAETFRFLLEIGFNNNADWFEANRKRYEQFVRDPMRRLAAALMPTALDITAAGFIHQPRHSWQHIEKRYLPLR